HVFVSIDNSLSNTVTTNDSSEDIDKDSFYVRVFQNDFESCFYTFCICSSSYVKEVCRLKSSMFDKIHRCHSKTSSVYHTAYVSVKVNIVKTNSFCFNFDWIF